MAVEERKPGQVKGLAFLSTIQALGAIWGEPTARAAVHSMTDAVRVAFEYGVILPSGWYPVSWYTEMWQGIRSSTKGDLEVVKQLGREAFRHDLNVVHRIMMKVVSPQTVVSFGTRLTALYYSGVETSFSTQLGFAKGSFYNALGWDENMWAEIHGALEVMLELARATQIEVILTAGGGRGDEFAEFEGRWQ